MSRCVTRVALGFIFGLVLVAAPAALASGAGGGATLGLPNRALTPGATNPRVRAQNIHSTICVAGYSASVRPSESYTERLKFFQLDHGYNVGANTQASNYEEDHLIPLEVGGSPTSVKNLWPEPRDVRWGAALKDRLENVLHRLVCAGRVSLVSAQRVFSTNWIDGYRRYVGGL